MSMFYYRLPSFGLGWGAAAVSVQNVSHRTVNYLYTR